MSLKTKGITIVSFLTSILMGVSGGGFASAETASFRIGDNPDSPQDVVVSHVIRNAYPLSNATVGFGVSWCEDSSFQSTNSSFRPMFREIKFVDVLQNDDGDAVASITLPFSDMSFSAAGTYELCVHEERADPSNGIPAVDSTQFKVIVDVVNEYDSNGEPTGNLIPTLVPQALNTATGEKGEILFETATEKTAWQFTHNVDGAKADRDHYFPYEVWLPHSRFLAAGTVFELEGLDESFVDSYTGRTKKNPKTITAGQTKIRVYLKDGQTLKLGQRNGKDDLPPESPINIEAMTESELEENYSVAINGAVQTSFMSDLRLRPGENASDDELLAFEQNNKVKAVRTSRANAVSTGLVARIMPFVAVVFAAGVAGFVAYNNGRKKKTRSS